MIAVFNKNFDLVGSITERFTNTKQYNESKVVNIRFATEHIGKDHSRGIGIQKYFTRG